MKNVEPVPFCIRIGVSGHRALDDPDGIKMHVEEALDKWLSTLFKLSPQKQMSSARTTCKTPIVFNVLSPLAEGSDRLVARVVLSRSGATLQVVLPFSVDDYLEDFEAEESKQEFREMFGLCRRPVMLRTRLIQDEWGQFASRTDAYKAAGEYVVDHCDVLIAVWDGEPARGRGGTAEIVQYALAQDRPVIRVWKDACTLLNPATSGGLASKAFEAIDRFNRQSVSYMQRAEYVRNLDHDLFERPRMSSAVSKKARETVNRCLLPHYARASTIAKQNQGAFYRAGRSIYLLSAASVGCAAIGVLWSGLAAFAFGSELLLLVIIAATLTWARRSHAHQGWVEHRFLVERIRSAIFMAIAGVEPKPIEVLPFMGHSQTASDWTVRLFNEIWGRVSLVGIPDGNEVGSIRDYICEAWIEDQIKFHENKRRSEGRMRRLLAELSSVVLPLTVAAAALHLLLASWTPDAASSTALINFREAAHRGLAFIALLFPAVAAALAGMEAHREHLRLEKRHANMVPQLERLKRQMASATDPARFEVLLHQMDELTLRESQDWLMLMRYVEIKAG